MTTTKAWLIDRMPRVADGSVCEPTCFGDARPDRRDHKRLYQPTVHKDIRSSLGWKIFPHYAMALLALLISCLGLVVAGNEYRDRQQ